MYSWFYGVRKLVRIRLRSFLSGEIERADPVSSGDGWLARDDGDVLEAAGQSIEAARAARDRAKADLIRAQEAFDRADEAYINARGGAAPKPAVTPPASTPAAAPTLSVVAFSLSGPGALEVNPLDYRARLIIDERPGEWTQHASGAKDTVPPGTRLLAYEVQNNTRSDPIHPAWKTICQGSLPLKAATTVDIAITQKVTCNLS